MKISGGYCAAGALGAAILVAGVSAAAAASFDGTWSVSVATMAGACDSSFRFPLQIANGRVVSRDIAGLSGHVDRRGAILVSIRQAARSAIGSGRLWGNAGAGRWTGRSASGGCVGRWQATRF